MTADAVASIYASSDADVFLSLDLPPTLACNKRERKRRYAATLRFFEIIAKRIGLSRLAPVVHGRDVDEVARNAEALWRITPSPPMVCVGGLVPLLRRTGGVRSESSQVISFIANSLSVVRSVFPRSMLHALGAGAPRTVVAALALGADSVDSIAWRRAAGFGTVFAPGSGERFVETRQRARPSSRPNLLAKEVASCRCPICGEVASGARISALSTGYRARAAHNAWVLLEEAAEFRRAKLAGTLASHLQSRLPASWISMWQLSVASRRMV
jgi:tRNA-guanine family transglycosylase